jgi:hypothetical protein
MSEKVSKATLDAFGEQEALRDETLVEYIVRTVDDKFIETIPIESIKQLPKTYMYMLGALTHALATACFIIFVMRGYRHATTKEFMVRY